jgi:hypothetical protein
MMFTLVSRCSNRLGSELSWSIYEGKTAVSKWLVSKLTYSKSNSDCTSCRIKREYIYVREKER